MKDTALQFFHTLDAQTRGDLDRCLPALKTFLQCKLQRVVYNSAKKPKIQSKDGKSGVISCQITIFSLSGRRTTTSTTNLDATDARQVRVAGKNAANDDRLRFSQVQ